MVAAIAPLVAAVFNVSATSTAAMLISSVAVYAGTSRKAYMMPKPEDAR